MRVQRARPPVYTAGSPPQCRCGSPPSGAASVVGAARTTRSRSRLRDPGAPTTLQASWVLALGLHGVPRTGCSRPTLSNGNESRTTRAKCPNGPIIKDEVNFPGMFCLDRYMQNSTISTCINIKTIEIFYSFQARWNKPHSSSLAVRLLAVTLGSGLLDCKPGGQFFKINNKCLTHLAYSVRGMDLTAYIITSFIL